GMVPLTATVIRPTTAMPIAIRRTTATETGRISATTAHVTNGRAAPAPSKEHGRASPVRSSLRARAHAIVTVAPVVPRAFYYCHAGGAGNRRRSGKSGRHQLAARPDPVRRRVRPLLARLPLRQQTRSPPLLSLRPDPAGRGSSARRAARHRS